MKIGLSADRRPSHVRMRTAIARALPCALLTGCTPAPQSGPTSATSAQAAGDASGPAAPSSAGDAAVPQPALTPVAVEVHEWGLLGMAVTDPSKTVSVAAGPLHPPAAPELGGLGMVGAHDGATDPDMAVTARGKPVLYFHLLQSEPVDLRVSLRLPRSEVREHWPAAELSREGEDSTLTWNVRVGPGDSCGPLAPFPSVLDEACTAVKDGYCEQADLANYVTEDAACLSVGDAHFNHLFYRAASAEQALPVRARLSDEGPPVLTLDKDRALPDVVLHVVRRGGTVRAWEFPLLDEMDGRPLPGADEATARGGVEIADPSQWLADRVRRVGLTESETAAFMRAWSSALFEPLPPDVSGARRVPGFVVPPGLAPSPDALLYILDPTDADALAPLASTPPVSRTLRAYVGFVDLEPPSGAALNTTVRE